MPELFDKHGGFRRLHSFTLATIVQVETLRFCRRFLTFDHREASTKFYDPKGRQYDQMTQAARSGRQNIIEGSERSSTSKDTEMKLTDVARASPCANGSRRKGNSGVVPDSRNVKEPGRYDLGDPADAVSCWVGEVGRVSAVHAPGVVSWFWGIEGPWRSGFPR
jgi:hypothetical protein